MDKATYRKLKKEFKEEWYEGYMRYDNEKTHKHTIYETQDHKLFKLYKKINIELVRLKKTDGSIKGVKEVMFKNCEEHNINEVGVGMIMNGYLNWAIDTFRIDGDCPSIVYSDWEDLHPSIKDWFEESPSVNMLRLENSS